jgi:RNA polymerase sigma-70 factor (ECF subfamily)
MNDTQAHIRTRIDALYKTESRRILATLIRLLGDFDVAEDAMHDAFAVAAQQWASDGIPENPRAWIISAARFKAIDAMRRNARFVPDRQGGEAAAERLTEQLEAHPFDVALQIDKGIQDDELRLIFTCCHPALTPEARIALTLREVCDLTTEEIARAFLTTPPTLAQRIVRAKAKLRDERIPFEIPRTSELPERLGAVLHVIYLVFNEGYSASSGDSVTRADLTREAIRLGRLLRQLLPAPEVTGLLALMLLQESRRTARTDAEGNMVLLEEQDRSLWHRALIDEGLPLVRQSLSSRQFGPYTIQAAIAAVHSSAPSAAATKWSEIVGLYDILLRMDPSPIVELNRAVAVAMQDGPAAGVTLIDALLERGELQQYLFAHSARGELCRRAGRADDARRSFEQALLLARQEPERRFLQRQLEKLKTDLV